MLVKLTCLLVLINISGKGFAKVPTEEEKQKVYMEQKDQFWDKCKSTISEESLVLFEDDWEADNEEIRKYRYCGAEVLGFIVDDEINVDNFLNFVEKNFPDIQIHELAGARALLESCKNAGKNDSDKYTGFHEFSKCVRRESAAKGD